uniref:MADS-box domain-containing protein n=1 Tax=Kalanchoe fedtschenkoi TaxID=63787 RepID=A0A7N0UBM4_KALFE
MGTGRKKINIEKVENISRRRVTLSKRRQGLFKKMEKFGIVTGFDVTAVVFSVAGKPMMFGDIIVFQRFMTEVLGSGGDFEFDEETAGNTRLGFEKLGEEVKECLHCKTLVMIRNKLIELKDKLKGVLSDEETEARAKQSSLSLLKALRDTEKKKLDFLEKSLKEITTLCDVDALFVCATKSNKSSESSFYTYPDDKHTVRKLIIKCCDYFRKPIIVDKVLPHSIVCGKPMSDIAAKNPVSRIAVSAEKRPTPQSTVTAEKLMSPSISTAEKVLAATSSKSELVKKANSIIKLSNLKLAMLKEAKVANEEHGMHRAGSTEAEVLEGSSGKLLPYIKFL